MSFKLPGVQAASALLEKGAGLALQSATQGIASKANQVLSDAINKKVGNLLDFSKTGIGKSLGKLGINADLSQFTGAGGSAGWLAKAASRGDPMLQMDWYVVMPLGLPVEYVESVAAPKSNHQQGPGVFMAGQRFFFADVLDTGSVTVAFYEDNKLVAHNYIKAWKSLISNPDGTFNLPAVYKQPIILLLQDAKGNTLGRIVMHGCWPQTESPYEATSGNSERVIVTVEFSCDRVDVEISGASSPAGSAMGKGIADTLTGFLKGGVATIGASIGGGIQTAVNTVASKLTSFL